MDLFDQSFRVLYQVIVPTIRDAWRQPREESFDCALFRRAHFGKFFARKLNIEIPGASQPQRHGKIDNEEMLRSSRVASVRAPIKKKAHKKNDEKQSFHFASVA